MMKIIYKLSIVFVLVPSIVFAFNDKDKKKHEKSKSINKSFKVNRNALLDINNKYGDININTWNQNTVEIAVKITVKGNNIDDVENRLEGINIEFNSSNSLVEATTVIAKQNNWGFWKKSKNISYEINYTVKLPVTNNVKLNNEYGDIRLDELEGNADINCEYGNLNLGDLRGEDTSINLEYCSASSIDSMRDGNINLDYSKITIDKAASVDLNADYSTVKFNDIQTLMCNTDYGGIEAEKLNSGIISGDYTSFRFGTVSKSLKLRSDYGSVRVKNLSKEFDFLDINSEYAGIKIGIEPGTNFNFYIDLQYAGFKRSNNKVQLFKSIEKNSKKYYEGTYGNGTPTGKVTINSQYGSVSFYEN